MAFDFNQALINHGEYKPRFLALIEGRSKVDTTQIPCKEGDCELGKWLSGDGKAKYTLLGSYIACFKRHGAFHQEMDKVIALINSGRYDEAVKLLGESTNYAITYTAFINAVKQFKQEVKL